ncbi:MAG: FkbM family methyltransferase [Bacteroidota bacterium]|nr:FkbM family methyltransferase [Bacteroidota bacterium]
MSEQSIIKRIVKQIIKIFPVGLTENERIDRLTNKVISRVSSAESIFIDVGAHKGKILRLMHKAAPHHKHYAFEPIDELYNMLEAKYGSIAHIYKIALSDQKNLAPFNLVVTDMAYSGLQKRAYDKPEKDVAILVETDLLDNIIPSSKKIALLKIDVEGGEMLVLKGAEETIRRSNPIILFEFGKAGAEAYQNTPAMMYNYFSEKLGYEIYTLPSWLQQLSALSPAEFQAFYESGEVYFFLAAPSK